MTIRKGIWVEAWIDSASGDYILLLRCIEDGKLELTDPSKSNAVIEIFENYEDAVHWLNEDEYDLLEGRYELD